MNRVTAKVIKANSNKSIDSSNAIELDKTGFSEIIEPPYNKKQLQEVKEQSSILQQCIEAYKQNIPGFGASLKYRVDESQTKENAAMKNEWDMAQEFIKFFNFEKSFEDVWKDAIEDRESCGEGYIEILRDGTNLPVGGEVVDTTTIKVTKLGELVEVTYKKEGKTYIRKKRFRRYVQEINSKKIFFKEFGDPRILNCETGKFEEETPEEKRATELIQLKIGNKAYGVPRWVGCTVAMVGARKAEELNYNYFKQGRHTPLAILVKNGILSEDSEAALGEYAASVEGSDNAHKFLLLQVEEIKDNDSISLGDDDKKKNTDIELKDLASTLQQDALFLDYDEATRKKVQSSFRLPDIYVGRSNDFNRATAEAAIEITEKQVFIPERKSLAFTINNCLLDDYNLQYVDLGFNNPDISNTDDKVKMINVLGTYNAIAPNDLREEAGKVLGKSLDNFDSEEANLPPYLANKTNSEANTLPLLKAQTGANVSDITNILKDVRDVLEELKDGQDN
jgi:PBSX family phage portal protein